MSRNKYHIAENIKTLLEVFGPNGQKYTDLPAPESLLPLGNVLKIGSISDGRLVIFGTVEETDYAKALKIFDAEVDMYRPKIVFLMQTSLERDCGLVIYKEGESSALLGVPIYGSTGGSFTKFHKPTLERLIGKNIPNAFYRYWEEVLMATPYSTKILLMCSALEALAKAGKGCKHDVLRKILGTDLHDRLFQQKSGLRNKHAVLRKILGINLYDRLFQQKSGLRNKLVHGEYYENEDAYDIRYEEIHEKVVLYFKDTVLGIKSSSPFDLEVSKHPQRNSGAPIERGMCFVGTKPGTDGIDAIALLTDLKNKINSDDCDALGQYFKKDSPYYIEGVKDIAEKMKNY